MEQEINENEIKCERCQKVVKKSDSVTDSIIYRTREFGKTVVRSKNMVFCSGICAAHEQMAMEG